MKCPICNSPFNGRSDKRYCSDQCRYIANNKSKVESEGVIVNLNKTLRKNRSILKKLCPIGKTTVRKEILVALGYDTNFFTSIYLTSNKQIYYICYDYAFMPIIENNIQKALIVTKQQHMNLWDPWRYVKKNP